MTNITKLKNSLKTLPIIAVLAVGFALTPTTSIAANDRGHHNGGYSKHSAKHQDKGHYRGNKHSYRGSGKHHNKGHHRSNKHSYKHSANGHKNSIGHHINKHYNKHHYGRHNNHYPRYDRHYGHRGHNTTHYVVNDYGHNGHYHGLNHLRFMIGLHTDNFDITFRD